MGERDVDFSVYQRQDIDADMEYWRTLRRFNREELSIISAKMKEIEERQDQQKWKA